LSSSSSEENDVDVSLLVIIHVFVFPAVAYSFLQRAFDGKSFATTTRVLCEPVAGWRNKPQGVPGMRVCIDSITVRLMSVGFIFFFSLSWLHSEIVVGISI